MIWLSCIACFIYLCKFARQQYLIKTQHQAARAMSSDHYPLSITDPKTRLEILMLR
jgi:hypothetical protein